MGDFSNEAEGVDISPFELSGIYLLNTEGIILSHQDVDSPPEFDVDLFGSMFTAIKIFMEDSLQTRKHLESINCGGYKILIENSNDFFLVLVGSGEVSESVRDYIRNVVERISIVHGYLISHWNGDMDALSDIDDELKLIASSFKSERKQGV